MVFNSYVGTLYRSEKESAGVFVLTNFIMCITLSASYFYTPYISLPYIVGKVLFYTKSVDVASQSLVVRKMTKRIFFALQRNRFSGIAGFFYVLTMVGFLKLDLLIRKTVRKESHDE